MKWLVGVGLVGVSVYLTVVVLNTDQVALVPVAMALAVVGVKLTRRER
jgi:hypothetical protein